MDIWNKENEFSKTSQYPVSGIDFIKGVKFGGLILKVEFTIFNGH